MAVVVRDYKRYQPWGLVLAKNLFGPVTSSGSALAAAAAVAAAAAAVGVVEDEDEDETPLIDLEDRPTVGTPPVASALAPGRADDPGVGPSVVASPSAASPPAVKSRADGDDDDEPSQATKKRASSPTGDPFRTLYEGAKHAKLSGKGKGKERE